MCFTCGERWSKDHKCSQTVQLHVVEELLEAFQGDMEEEVNGLDSSQKDSLMALLASACNGTDSTHSFRVKGLIQGTKLLMLIDSGSSHSFLDENIVQTMQGVTSLPQPVKVKVASGEVLICDKQLPDYAWWLQGRCYRTNFKLLSLPGYDAILGIDWLQGLGVMRIIWVQKWLEYEINGSPARIQGVMPKVDACPLISGDKLMGLCKMGALMHLFQITSETDIHKPEIPIMIQEVMNEFNSVFEEPQGLPPRRRCDHSIPLIPGSKPVNLRPYGYNPAQKDEIEQQVRDMLKSGVIHPSVSPYSSLALLVNKKDGTWRLCVDHRLLNAITIKSKYPLPVIDELLDELAGTGWFSKLDLRAGYHQIRLVAGEEPKTAFQTHFGHFEYRVMSFGLTGALATFQGAMNETLASVLRKCALVFFDDILIYSPTLEAHAQDLRTVLQLLQDHQWKVKLSKCSFALKELNYLGHTIGVAGVSTDPSKVQDIVNWAIPTTLKKLRGFLGIAGYYHKFVKNFGVISKPLTNLLRKGVEFVWTPEVHESFEQFKKALASAPVLALPDFTKPSVIETDASEIGIGAVLSQDKHPIAYMSKALGPRTRGLSTYEKECLAILLAIEHWRSYLQYAEFTILTDHKSLMNLTDQRLHTPWQQKAYTKLLGLQFKICYKKGIHNEAADARSRCDHNSSLEVVAISVCKPTWLEEVVNGYLKDAKAT